MRRALLVALVAALVTAGLPALADPPEQRNFRAHLSGDEEVPPAETRAQGQAIFQLSKDGDELHYKLIVANIENVVAAHIHLAPRGSNGPVVVWLYGPVPSNGGRVDGVLAEGVITASDLVGPLADEELSDLIGAITSGNAYVNVHTAANAGGEVRGQIR